MSTELETALSRLRQLANDIDDSAGWALKTAEGSASRDRHTTTALAALDDLTTAIDDVRAGLGALA